MASEHVDLQAGQGMPGIGPDLSAMVKLTRGHSCVLCQQRKVRCDKQKPCANCVKAGVDCKVVPPQPPRRRKKKPHERDLIERLKKYESLLSQHGVKFEPIAHDLKPSDGLEDVADLEHDLGGLKTTPSSDYNSTDGVPPDKQYKWFPYYKEYRSTDPQADSSDEEYERPTIHHAFDKMFENEDGFPFVVGGTSVSVTHQHPSAIQIFQLWQVYITNVNPLLKISHVPTLQGQIIGASANTAKIDPPLEALMFAIYFAALTSMPESDVHTTFGEDKSLLLAKYHSAAQQALINAGFMRSPDLVALQAFFLYLLCIRQYVDPRALFCLIGIAVRKAQMLGLHRDAAQFGITPFETELRRRLWWQIVIFDKRIAEITGSTINALSSSIGGDCKLPLNINDTDLNVQSKDQPVPYVGPTEMVFCLSRIELSIHAAPPGSRPLHPAPMGAVNKVRIKHSPSPMSPDVSQHMANSYLPQDVSGFCNYIEDVYLKQCDPKIPTHFFTLMMSRQALCKLRIIDFLARSTPVETLEEPEQDALFTEAIQMIEYDNIILTSDMLRGYIWYTYLHFPFPAYMLLVAELRRRRTGELVDRAWEVVIENHERRDLMKNLRSPMHMALGAQFVKAWDYRVQVEAQAGRTFEEPKMITAMRQVIMRFQPPMGQSPGQSQGSQSQQRTTPSTEQSGGSRQPPINMTPGRHPSSADTSGLGGVPPSMMPDTSGLGGGPPDMAGMMNSGGMMFAPFDPTQQLGMAGPGAGGGVGGGGQDFGQMDWAQFSGFFGGFPSVFAQPPQH